MLGNFSMICNLLALNEDKRHDTSDYFTGQH